MISRLSGGPLGGTSTGRGWRLDKSAHDVQIDAAIALAMAVERAEHQPEAAVQLLGFL